MEAAVREAEERAGLHTRLGRVRAAAWDLLEYPETSRLAQWVAAASVSIVLLSTLTFLLEAGLEDDQEVAKEVLVTLRQLDTAAITFFSLELLVRLAVCPAKLRFLRSPLNIVDLLAVLPFFLSLLLAELQDMQIIGKAGKFIRLVRLMRILRILKMIRHFSGLKSLLYTIHKAYKEVGLILLIVLVTVLSFSAALFAFEREGPVAEAWPFYDCIWWGLQTVTTVGYHAQPATSLGKLTCGLCALTGVFIVTLPIPIVVSSFAQCYKSKLWRTELAARRRLADGAASRWTCYDRFP